MVEYDAVVVGAGIIGLSTAYHMKNLCPNHEIIVVDKMRAAGQGNTAKSAAMFRCFFYSTTNLTLVDSSVEFFKHVQEKLGVNLKIRWTGYLWLFSEEDYNQIKDILGTMSKLGLTYQLYEERELAEKLELRTSVTQDEEAKIMNLADVYTGIFIPKAGSIDVESLVKFYEMEFLKLGGKISYGTEVKNLIVEPSIPLGIPNEPHFWQESRVAGVDTNKGTIKARKTVVCIGAWASKLLDPIGIDAHVKPIKRQIFCIKANSQPLSKLLWTKNFNKEGCMPFLILPKPKVYIKPALEEEAFWLCYGDDFPRAYKLEEDPQPEEDFYKYGIYQIVTKYLPQFKDSTYTSAFAGLYAVNTLDKQPLIFEQNDLIFAGGTSGSGIMKADAMGRITAALYAGKPYAILYGEKEFKIEDLGLRKRKIEPEKFVI